MATCKRCGNQQMNDMAPEGRVHRCDHCYAFMRAATQEEIDEYSWAMHEHCTIENLKERQTIQVLERCIALGYLKEGAKQILEEHVPESAYPPEFATKSKGEEN